jgi:guanylate kinase
LKGSILVLSGPSGAGKSTIIERATPLIGEFYFSISTTTREPRAGERDGVEYHFIDRESFEQGIENGDFLEYARVHDNYYGTSLKPVREALEAGKLVIFDIDVQGHKLVCEKIGELVTSVFITPPSLEELKKRLESRALDSEDVIKKRVENAKKEVKSVTEYDYLIINDDLDRAIEQFVAVAKVARLNPFAIDVEDFIKSWS